MCPQQPPTKKIKIDQQTKDHQSKQIDDGQEDLTFLDNELQKETTFKQTLREEEFRKKFTAEKSREEADKADEKQKAQTLWAELGKKSKELLDLTKQYSYVEYTTAMMDLIAACVVLNEAVFHSHPVKNACKFVWENTLGRMLPEGLLDGLEYEFDNSIDKGKSKIKELLKGNMQLEYQVTFDANGVLDTRITLNGKDLSEKLKLNFDTAMVVWAEKNGFQFDQTQGTLKAVSAPHEPMNKAKFAELNLNSETSFHSFFHKHFALNLAPTPTPTPTPIPNQNS